jgi:uncharacterized membrane protein YfhO
MRDPDFDSRTTAVLVGDPAEAAQQENSPAAAGAANITGYQPEQVTVETESATGGLLVLTDAYYPGWRATVDGEPAPLYQTDSLFRGVFVPPGRHEVRFEYESTAYRVGLIFFIFTTIIIAAVLIMMALDFYSKR